MSKKLFSLCILALICFNAFSQKLQIIDSPIFDIKDNEFYLHDFWEEDQKLYSMLKPKKQGVLPGQIVFRIVISRSSDMKTLKTFDYTHTFETLAGVQDGFEVKIIRGYKTDKGFQFIWAKDKGWHRDYYVETVSNDLERITGLKMIHTVPAQGEKYIGAFSSVCFDEKRQRYVFVEEMPSDVGLEKILKLSFYDIDFKLVKSFKNNLPFGMVEKQKSYSFGDSRDYEKPSYCLSQEKVDKNGNIFITSNFDLSRKQRKKRIKNNTNLDTIKSNVGIVNYTSEKLESFKFKFKGKYLTPYSLIERDSNYEFYGLFAESPRKNMIYNPFSGVYKVVFNDEFKLVDSVFTFFNAQYVFDLYQKDQPGPLRWEYKKEKKKISYERKKTLDGNYIVEDAIKTEDGGVIMIIGTIERISKQDSYDTGIAGGIVQLNYWNLKKYIVVAIKINRDGSLGWSKAVPRFCDWHGQRKSNWYVKDVNVLDCGDEISLLFNNESDYNLKKDIWLKKPKEELAKIPKKLILINKQTGSMRSSDVSFKGHLIPNEQKSHFYSFRKKGGGGVITKININ